MKRRKKCSKLCQPTRHRTDGNKIKTVPAHHEAQDRRTDSNKIKMESFSLGVGNN